MKNERIEELLRSFLPKEEGIVQTLLCAMNESVLSGGKRLRPRMLEESYRLFGGTGDLAEPFMAALEMIHCYSLIHDDLPCMDNDTLRRGRPTTWVTYGEAAALLAGDALLTYAFETAALAFGRTDRPERVAEALRLLARKAGPFGVCGGQALDAALTGRRADAETLEQMYAMKTSALFEAAFGIGAILAGAAPEDTARMEQAGRLTGLAFQIRDDILDATASSETLGKPAGSDVRNGKQTYVTRFGTEEAVRAVSRLTQQAKDCLRTVPGDTGYFLDLLSKLEIREN